MAKVPDSIRRWITEPTCGSRRVWRAFLSFRNREKRKEFLSVAMVMQMAGALEQYGATPKEIERRSQRLMASMLGIDVSTFCRRLGQFTEPDGRWDEQRRQRHSALMKQSRAKNPLDADADPAGSSHQDPAGPRNKRQHRQVQRIATIFHKSPGWGQAQLYGLHMAPELKPAIEDKGEDRTRDARLLAAAFGDHLFDPTRAGVNGFKAIPAWIWDPRLPDVKKCECQSGQMGLPLSKSEGCQKCAGRGFHILDGPMPDYGRVLLTFLLLKGLQQYGNLEITQEEIGDALGMDVNTVAKYEDKLEALLIIRCVAGEVSRDAAGAVTDRKAHKIIWLPDRMMDEEIAEREYKRFQALREKIRDQHAYNRAEAIHVALVKQWQGKEHSIKAFWNELYRQLTAAAIPQRVLDAIIPTYRE